MSFGKNPRKCKWKVKHTSQMNPGSGCCYEFNGELHWITQDELDSAPGPGCWRTYAYAQDQEEYKPEPILETLSLMEKRPNKTRYGDMPIHLPPKYDNGPYDFRDTIFIFRAARLGYYYTHIAAILNRSPDAIRLRLNRHGVSVVPTITGTVTELRTQLRHLLAEVYHDHEDN